MAVGAIAAFLYAQDQSQQGLIADRDARISQLQNILGDQSHLIASLNSTISTKNESIAALQSDIGTLSGRISALSLEVAALQANQSASSAQLGSLKAEALSLQNESARLQLELSLTGRARGVFVVPFFINMTWTAAANSTVLLASSANGDNGTLVMLGNLTTGCISSGTSGLQGMQGFSVLVGTGMSGGVFSFFQREGPAPFSVYLMNSGSISQTCVLTLVYVYQTSPTY